MACSESWAAVADVEPAPDETASLGRASDGRRHEFALGRMCARRAISLLGLPPEPILRGPAREPVWPAGIVGSITHCPGYAAAVVGRPRHARSVGIDAEVRRSLPSGVLALIATERERRWLDQVDDRRFPWDAVLFSAKESVFKAWFPVTRSWLGFDEANVDIDPSGDRFVARLTPHGPALPHAPTLIGGRFRVTETHVFTCAHLPATTT